MTTAIPTLRTESWPIERLMAYAQNARTHSEEQVTQIAASIAEFGFNNPVLVDPAGEIIAGHGRVLALRRLHYTRPSTTSTQSGAPTGHRRERPRIRGSGDGRVPRAKDRILGI